MYKIFSLVYLTFFLISSANAQTINVFEFTNAELSNLEVRKIRGADNKTVYSVEI